MTRARWIRSWPWLVASLLASCAPRETPATPATTSASIHVAGEASTAYAEPVPVLHGWVRLTTYGVVDVRDPADAAIHLRAVHVRVLLRNENSRVWTLDVRDQRLEIPQHGRSTPAFAATSDARPDVLPVLVVAPGETRVADLFFPLPADLQSVAAVPAYDAITWLNVGDDVAVARTPFAALVAAANGRREGWAPPFWYNPFYQDFAFLHAVEIPRALAKGPLDIRSEPPPRP